ncbi:methyltransferase domain-containing protein [Membranihabitans maritimus]|uniref:methyltransferase domain-containing protein n=1 Tax=Membranihabitans maritimus TaxID=2904244 RepID=UPI001F1594A8|nr:methyltransferase domain-containing protein [Membranihabitans maritimus]
MEHTLTWNPGFYNNKHAFVFNYGRGLIDLLQPKKNERILDLGCGAGQLTDAISKFTTDVVGIDNSPEMIEDARKSYPDIDFRVMDASNFSLDKPFDAIFSNAALHWVKKYKEAARCMYDNLNEGGRLVIEMGGHGNVETITNSLQKLLSKKGYLEQSRFFPWYFPTMGAYAAVLENVGFRVLVAQHYDRPTELADEATGIMDWLNMFGDGFFAGVDEKDRAEIIHEVQEDVKPELFHDRKWYADYKRLRILAHKH